MMFRFMFIVSSLDRENGVTVVRATGRPRTVQGGCPLLFIFKQLCMYACMYICMHVCVCACMYVLGSVRERDQFVVLLIHAHTG